MPDALLPQVQRFSTVPRAPDELIKLAASASWQDRCDAAEALARYDDDRFAHALLRLLTDEADTAPIESAARALIGRRDEWGAQLIFRAITVGDDDASDHLVYFVDRDAHLGGHTIWQLAERNVSSSDQATRAGASELLRPDRRAPSTSAATIELGET
jgi:hypothetical protein